MARVPFGTTSSPFLLAATLQHHFEELKQKYPETVAISQQCIHVDDLLCGAANDQEATKMYEETNRVFEAASMRLHKWGSNSDKMRQLFARENPDGGSLRQSANLLKVLRLTWDPRVDSLTILFDTLIDFAKAQENTKRFVLQMTARLYDPLGLLFPYTVREKALFQEIWKENLSWDQPLPDHLLNDWNKWCEELTCLREIKVPRTYDAGAEGKSVRRTLHIFADASPKAYGAAVYLCREAETGAHRSTLVLAKCRVAPLKTIPLARLELMAALLASRLYQFVWSNLDFAIDNFYL